MSSDTQLPGVARSADPGGSRVSRAPDHPYPRLLPILYFGAAHTALGVACLAVALDPRGVAGFFYHPRMLGVVHLVTLGWVTASILGALYIVGPVALRVRLRVTWRDYGAFGLLATGIVGMVAHFWIQDDGGMAWSAALVATGILTAGVSVVPPLAGAKIPRAVRAHIVFAFLNILGAATMGGLIAFDKVYHFLPGFVLSTVFAHAHLAAVGWASMMVVGLAYRLLPMVLPAEMPTGSGLWCSAILLQVGVSGLCVTLLLRSPVVSVFALIIVAGFGTFLWYVGRMVRRARPRPRGWRTPDPAVLHAAAAGASLVVAMALGTWLTLAEPSSATLRVAMAYGVFGLVGFLAQMVVGMKGRLLPFLAWYWASANVGHRKTVPPPYTMPWRTGQHLVFACWLVGVPALAGGLAFDGMTVISVAAWCLLLATVLDSMNVTGILRHAFTSPAITAVSSSSHRRAARRAD